MWLRCGNGVMSAAAFLGGFGCAFGMGWLIALVWLGIESLAGFVQLQVLVAIRSPSSSSSSVSLVTSCLHMCFEAPVRRSMMLKLQD